MRLCSVATRSVSVCRSFWHLSLSRLLRRSNPTSSLSSKAPVIPSIRFFLSLSTSAALAWLGDKSLALTMLVTIWAQRRRDWEERTKRLPVVLPARLAPVENLVVALLVSEVDIFTHAGLLVMIRGRKQYW